MRSVSPSIAQTIFSLSASGAADSSFTLICALWPGGIDVHAAAAPRDVDLTDVLALADAEHAPGWSSLLPSACVQKV